MNTKRERVIQLNIKSGKNAGFNAYIWFSAPGEQADLTQLTFEFVRNKVRIDTNKK